jgi:UDP-N-acetylmuramoylalanine--D-glutamate ligase
MTDAHSIPVPGSRTLVVGLGKTGLSVVRWLHAQGREFAVTDSRAQPPGLDAVRSLAPDAAIRVGSFDLGLLERADSIVLSPGVSPREPIVAAAQARGLPVIGDIELFARAVRRPVIGITGTNGKSTVTTLVGLMAEAAGRRTRVGGNLGEPALDLLAGAEADLYVLELSSFQLETTESLELVAGAVLNVTPDHMDRYASMSEYAAAKARLLRHCATAVVNCDDPWTREMPQDDQRVLGFSLERRGADYSLERDADGSAWLLQRGERLLGLHEMRIPGLHNAANALAALALGDAAGLHRAPMLGVLRSFTGLPHRTQWVAEIGGVRYIDDSKGTNVGATLAAVAGLEAPLVIVAGGDGKNQDFTPLAAAFAGKVRHTVLIGRDRQQLAQALSGTCPVTLADSMPAAVAVAARVAQPGDTVLLSPACASLDMFRDYAHRGAEFAAAVRSLAA